MLVRMWRKVNPRALLVGMQTGTATVENSMEVPQKSKNRTTLLISVITSLGKFLEVLFLGHRVGLFLIF